MNRMPALVNAGVAGVPPADLVLRNVRWLAEKRDEADDQGGEDEGG